MTTGGAWFSIPLMESMLQLSVQPHDKKRNTIFYNTSTCHTPAAISHHDNEMSMVFFCTLGDQNLAELKYIPCYNWCFRFQSANRTMLELCYNIWTIGRAWFSIGIIHTMLQRLRSTISIVKYIHPIFPLLLSHHDNRRSMIFYSSNRNHAPAVDLT